MRRIAGRALAVLTVLTLLTASCSGGGAGTTSTDASSAAPTTAPATTASTTQAPVTATTPPTTQTAACGQFRQAAEDTAEYSYSIAYPIVLCDQGQELIPIDLLPIETFVAESIDIVIGAAAELDAKATLTAQIAPELLNEDVYSMSGVSTRFVDVATGTVGFRHGWIVSRADGSVIEAADLFLDGDLTALSDAARAHLIADVFGSEDALTGPDGLLPVPANFQAVWLTTAGIGVGFYEGQVAAPDAGTPAVLIPFGELDPFLDKTGVLSPLTTGDTLPEI